MLRILLLWALWCFLHSLLLSPTIKKTLCSEKTNRIAAYRLVYNTFAIGSLIPLAWFTQIQPQQVLFTFPGFWKLLQALLLGYGLLLFYLGAKAYDLWFFLGMRQVLSFLDKKPIPTGKFHQQGILCYIRHPWYSGGIAFLWGTGPVTDINLQVKLLLSVYIILGTVLEEKRLKKELGETYIEYCRRVPMLFPWKSKGNRSPG